MPPFEIIRPPDQVVALRDQAAIVLAQTGEGRFENAGIVVDAQPAAGVLSLRLRSLVSLRYLQLRWRERIPEGLRYLSDTWNQRVAPLEWRCLVPERPLPWYFLAFDGQHTHAVGVASGASALCHWHVDPYGVTLWLDVCCGGSALQPVDRELHLADVTVRPGKVWEIPFQAARRFAAQLADAPLLPEQPVYGFCCEREQANAEMILARARLLAELSENTVNRPFLVVSRGWQHCGPDQGTVGMRFSPEVGHPAELAQAIANETCRPGLWLRPLLSTDPRHEACSLPADRFPRQPLGWVLDPTHPTAMEVIQENIRQAVAWGYELLRYDLTASDLLGPQRTQTDGRPEAGWRFHNPSLTTAEVLRHLYALIRRAAGGRALLAASDAIGHLAAGHAHIVRISEESGEPGWEPVRILGVNALAFRGFHHGALYAVETAAVPLDSETPWALSEQWLRLLSSSGATCFVAPGAAEPDATRRRALRSAFGKASRQLPLAEPVDWLATTSPGRWKLGNEAVTFDWFTAQYEALG